MLASGVLLGLAAGLAIRRSWQPLRRTHIRWPSVLIGSLLLRTIASFLGDASYPLYLAALGGTVIGAAVNYRLTGAILVALGGSLNLIVVLLNHGMPVDPGAVAMVSAQIPRDALHVALDAGTRLSFLADIIPVGVVRSVYSVGDVAIAVGGFTVPFVLFARR